MVTLYNMMQWEPNLWNNIQLPDGVDLQLTVDTIMAEYGTLDVVHNYPDMFMWANESWFRRKYWSIDRMYKTLLLEYDPIENYRRNESEWENNDDVESRNVKDNLTTHEDYNQSDEYRENTDYSSTKDNTLVRDRDYGENDNTDNSRQTVTSGTANTNGDVSAYNSESYVNDSRTTSSTSADENVTGNETRKMTGTENVNDVGKEIEKDDTIVTGSRTGDHNLDGTQNRSIGDDTSSNRKRKRGLLAFGNIGVTTSQQMIKEEREVVEFDFYRWLASEWAADNVVLCSI